MKKENTGTLILMAYPDSFVRLSNEFICNITPYLGIGTKDYIKAGHSALCLIENETGNIHYYDFGRYITPKGHGRVRSVKTDVELEIPISAKIQKGNIQNINDILMWLRQYPEKTHGEGDLYASVLSDVNYDDAHNFIETIRKKGSIPYGVFVKQGSNCSRFVADTVIASTTNKKILKKIARESLITPSPLGIVSKGRTSKDVYIVRENEITTINNVSWLKNMKNFLEKKYAPKDHINTENKRSPSDDLHYLDGIGGGAFFQIRKIGINTYSIRRYLQPEEMDFEDIFIPTQKGFDISKKYNFIYDSNCDHCHIEQLGIVYRFERKKT